MTKTKRAFTATAVTAAATAIALVPATAQAQHFQPQQGEVTSVLGHADYQQLSTHDRVLIGARGTADDGFGVFRIQKDNGTVTGKITCVTGSTATDGVTDAAIGVHISRSTIAALPRGTDAIEYVRDGGGDNPDASGLVTGTANCPESGFTVPDGVLVAVPAQNNDGNAADGRWHRWIRAHRGDECDNGGNAWWHRYQRSMRGDDCGNGNNRFDRGDGFRVQTRG